MMVWRPCWQAARCQWIAGVLSIKYGLVDCVAASSLERCDGEPGTDC